MSSSATAAQPACLPLVLLPSSPQAQSPANHGAAAAENSLDSSPTSSFADLVGELVQEIHPRLGARPSLANQSGDGGDTSAPATQPGQESGQLRVPVKLRGMALLRPLALSFREPVQPGRPTTGRDPSDPTGTWLPLVTVPVLRPLPSLTTGEAASVAGPSTAPAQTPDLQAGGREFLQLGANDTVLEVKLRTPETIEGGATNAINQAAGAPDKGPPAAAFSPAVGETIRPKPRAIDSPAPASIPEEPAAGTTPEQSRAPAIGAKQLDSQNESSDAPSSQDDERNESLRAARSIAGNVSNREPETREVPVTTPHPQTHQEQVPVPAATPVSQSEAPPSNPRHATPAGAAPAPAREPETPAHNTPPVRSLALEFTPDGGRDVRLRVTDRGGEVHVSLHSSDTSLTGKLREGVQDLAGALVNAGYDAEAWTPSDDSRRQQPEAPPEPKRGKTRSSGDTEDFAGMISNPSEERR